MLLGIPLFIMVFLAIFSVVAGSDWGQDLIDYGTNSYAEAPDGSGTFSTGSESTLFGMDALSGTLLIIIIAITIVAVIGLRIFDSGLSEHSIKVISTGLLYGGIWLSLSVLGYGMLNAIPVFGSILWVVLTLMYTIGVINKFNSTTMV